MKIFNLYPLIAFLLLQTTSPVIFAQSVELVCNGEIQTQLRGYTGQSKTNWTDDIKLEITFLPKSMTVTRAFSPQLLLSLCYLDAAVKQKCSCIITDDDVACLYKDNELGQSSFKINRKSATAKVFETSTLKNLGDMSTFTREKSAELSCKVFDKNQF